ncbi:hypothetical protein OBV_23630 [Oscillibacter valericigenes Sjm18-20]|nr:hypothetical protein OBV_23630 [Oscillibacter valericigenes Sjm18-20]
MQPGFQKAIAVLLWPEPKLPESFIHPAHARQATSAHSVTGANARCTALQVPNLFRTRAGYHMGLRPRTRTGLHENRVGLTMPLLIALSPQA